jgi:murein DD-endopeptidase MepM/ murein hydrolase activator NlpD
MKASYSILAPSYRRPASRRRWLGRSGTGKASWLFAMGCLVLGVPLALATSVYLLAARTPAQLEENYASADFSLPALPTAGLAPATGLSEELSDQAATQEASELALSVAEANTLPAEPAAVAVAPADPSRRVIRLAWGDTLLGLLAKAAVPEAEAHEALASLKGVYDPRQLKAGEEVVVRYDPAGRFSGFEFEPSAEQRVQVQRHDDNNYKAASIVRPLSSNVMAASINIEGSLYESGIKAGIPAGTMAELVKALSFSVDFQRDIHPGNSFKVLYEVKRNPEGVLVRTGDILYAEVKLNDRMVPVYRYRFADGRTELFDREGKSVRRALMRTPVNASRISSGFGMRRHPVMGYNRMHKGVDFAAPTGTPIYAAGDGVIVERGWKGGYGNYVRIRHNGTLQTAYGHMSRFSSGFSRGSRVKQGQVIGYVGSTGVSTGPHLHFEVLVNGAQVNPLRVANMSTGEALRGAHLDRLKGIVKAIDEQFASLPAGLAQDVAFSALTGEPVRPVQAKRLND